MAEEAGDSFAVLARRRIVLGVTNIPEEQPPRPETPSKVIPMESEHDMGYPPVDLSALDVE